MQLIKLTAISRSLHPCAFLVRSEITQLSWCHPLLGPTACRPPPITMSTTASTQRYRRDNQAHANITFCSTTTIKIDHLVDPTPMFNSCSTPIHPSHTVSVFTCTCLRSRFTPPPMRHRSSPSLIWANPPRSMVQCKKGPPIQSR